MEENINEIFEQPGLYDANNRMLCSWEESGIDIEKECKWSTYKTLTTAPYYVINNNYPTTRKIIISPKVTSIRKQAFLGCKSLTSIIIPNSVTNIGEQAFLSCTSLISIRIPDSVTCIGEGAFYNCTSLTSVFIPNSVNEIEYCAFDGCRNLTSVIIESGLKSIGSYAFVDCDKLDSITIPDSVICIGEFAFAYCSKLSNVIFEKTTEWYVNFSEDADKTAISSSDLANTTTAANYLYSTYCDKCWNRE